MASENNRHYENMNMDMEFTDEYFATSRSNESDLKFDTTIGHIEDILMEDEFQALQNNFLEKYYQEFDDSEENKFVYTDIHTEYINLVEKFLEEKLMERIPLFSMAEFMQQLISRKNELEGEIFEILLTFSDFLRFKEMFLDFKAEKEGRSVNLSAGITVTALGNADFSLDGCSLSAVDQHQEAP